MLDVLTPSRSLPRIGISTYRETARWGLWDERADILPASYSNLAVRSGGAPLLLPPAGDAETAQAVLSGLDGLVLAGGADIDPSRYSAVRSEHTDSPRADRDEWEFILVREARRLELPILGICRGMQLLNVALGGTLTQHLPDVVGSDLHCPSEGHFGHHPVRVVADSHVGRALNPVAGLDLSQLEVATHHHQGVAQLADGLIATAWASDGLIEAYELASAVWTVGVQWHPEASHEGAAATAQESANDAAGLAVMRAFIASCGSGA